MRGLFCYVVLPYLSETCVLCNIIRQCLNLVTGDLRKSAFACRFDWTGTAANISSPAVQLCFRGHDERPHQHVHLYSKGKPSSHNPFFSSLDIPRNPRSNELLGKLKAWLLNCDTHSECVSMEGDFVPARLICITDEADGYDTRVSSPTDQVRYAALSYCWGSSEQPTTTKANLPARYTGFQSSILPKTLQEAIFVTKSLGLKYIWIDSICIVQDDENEWSVQASKMASIYAAAYVVLAATSAKDSSDGFLHLREMPSRISSHDRWGHVVELEAMRNDSHDCYLNSDSTDFPLFKRGWCLQERLMARRVIHFLPHEALFVCSKERQCECDIIGKKFTERTTSGARAFKILSSLAESEDPNKLDQSKRFGGLWTDIVQEYSSMTLTNPKDVLPALSGIASSVAKLNPGPYIEGLWARDIAYQLAWSPNRYPSERQCAVPSLKDEPHRPTFSWTHWQYGIDFKDQRKYDESLCTFLSTDMEPATKNPYGPGLAGSIRLHGKTVSGLDLNQYIGTSPSTHIKLDQDVAFGLEISQEEAFPWERMVLLGLYHDTAFDRVCALLLQRCEEGPEYARIGLVEELPAPWFFEYAVDGPVTII
ncbi:heterokaryon incompatibility protein-domain-containing protein [Paraphoma chrysanthemicola]|uniref:Heterokaryon incompatibility protein-domain-containing protein n=1 Tax=Paraphoma chrysanthemicola TaxID=798071 RepID=A0A8K0QZG7_9PLEO|nr:heterokaryon incompatibility protein-domain-containing protein [Paraphoma chrysanthemicola]